MSSTRSCFRRVELRFSAPDAARSSRPNRARRLHLPRPRSQSRARIERPPRCLAPSPHPGDRSNRDRPRRLTVHQQRPPRRRPQPRLRPRGQELNCSRRPRLAFRHRRALHAPGPRSSVRRVGHPLPRRPSVRRESEARREPEATRESGPSPESGVSRSLIALRQLRPGPRPPGRPRPLRCRSIKSTRRPGQGERRSSARLHCLPRSPRRSFSPPRRHSDPPRRIGMPRLELGRFSSRAGRRLSGEQRRPQTRWTSLRCLASSPFRRCRQAGETIRRRW